MADIIGQAESAVQSAAPREIEAHRSFLTEALDMVGKSGNDPNQVTQQSGAGNVAPSDMTPAQLASTTLQLARRHPEIVQAVGNKFPEAQSLLSSILSPQSNVGGLEDEAMRDFEGMVSSRNR